jgi:hypothetical protein
MQCTVSARGNPNIILAVLAGVTRAAPSESAPRAHEITIVPGATLYPNWTPQIG